MRGSTLVTAVLVACLAASAAGAGDQDRPETPRQAADRVLAAIRAEDSEALKALAASDDPDPWLVANELRVRGERGAALEFAKAAPRPDVERLPDWISGAKATPRDDAIRDALSKANEALRRKDFDAVLGALEAVKGDPDELTSVRVALFRASVFAARRNHVEAASSFEAAAAAGAEIGWLRRVSAAWRSAGIHRFRLRDYRGAVRCAERALAVEERRGDLARQARLLDMLGAAHLMLRDAERALSCTGRAVKLAKEADRPAAAAGYLWHLAEANRALGRSADALEALGEAKEIYASIGNRKGVAGSFVNMALIHHIAGETDRAIEMYESGLREARAAGAVAYAANALNNLAALLIDSGRPGEAKEHLTELIAIARKLRDPGREAGALQTLGRMHQLLGELEEAIAQFRSALALYEETKNRGGEATALNALGLMHDKRGENREAIRVYREALAIRTEIGDFAGQAATLNNLGTVRIEMGEFTLARETLRRALTAAEKAGHVRWRANVLGNLGIVEKRFGDGRAARRHFRDALELKRKMKDWASASLTLGSIAGLHLQRGDHPEAIALYREAVALAERSRSEEATGLSLTGLAKTHESFGETERALELYQRARRIYDKDGLRRRLAFVLVDIGRVHSGRGEYGKAIECIEAGLALAEEIDAPVTLSWANVSLSAALLAAGDPARGVACAERARDLLERRNDRRDIAGALAQLARAQTAAGRSEEARDTWFQTVRRARDVEQRATAAAALRELAELDLDAGRPGEAVRRVVEAIEELRSQHRGLGEERAAGVRKRWAGLYGIGAEAGVRMKDPETVARFFEEGRAADLIASMGGREALRDALIPDELRALEQKARSEEAEAIAILDSACREGSLELARKARIRLDAAREGVFEAIDEVRRKAKVEARIVYPEIDAAALIRGRLREGEALALCGFLRSDCAAVVMTSSSVRVVPLGPAHAIAAAARIDFEDPAVDCGPGLARLRKLLVEPLGLGEETRRLLVSPEGLFSFLPFPALAPEMEVTFTPSGTTHGLLLAERQARGTGVLAVGDPDYGVGRDGSSLPAFGRGLSLTPLPFSRPEAKAIGDVVLLGKEATETGFRSTARGRPRWRAIHLACHGVQDARRPTLSALALTPDGENDGLLTCDEILSLPLRADLVTLSACDTARGKLYRGEGMLGLARAALTNCAPRVLSSLWKVDDEAAGALMVRFYELFDPKDGSPGLPAAAALRQAQAHIRGQSRWKHPRYWAAWVLWGLPD